MTDAHKLAESLRAMRRNAKSAYVSARPGACHSITMDSTRLGDLTDAADLIERQEAELADWRAVFGNFGATPDDCSNAIIVAHRTALAAEIKVLKEAPAVLLTDERVLAAVRLVQPDLDIESKAWDDLTEQCRRWLEADLAANGKAVS